MSTSLFVEHHANGLAFYLNGDLQFDTADEAIYHEYLVMPAIAIAVQRFPAQPLRVLICGGGDGLAARDVLRFPQVSEVTLVDYDPEVLELGRTLFAPYNQSSLLSEPNTALGESRITVHTREAFEFVSALPDRCYHAVICDFTFPTSSEATCIYSLEWFQQVQRILDLRGVMATNGVSPERNTTAFWCLYQTLLAAQLQAKPIKVEIPSFQRHEYGNWGFFIASETPISRSELEAISLPQPLKGLPLETWKSAFVLSEDIASDRHAVNIHTLKHPQLFYYLLNAETPLKQIDESKTIDFIDIQEIGTGLIQTQDPLQLESLVQVWLERMAPAQPPQQISTTALLPIQHHSHNSRMTKEWLGYIKSLLKEVDFKQLISSLAERAQELPPQLANEVKQLSEKLRSGQPITYLSHQVSELIVILSITLIMTNLAAPDAVFAKGSSYSSSSSSSGCDYYEDGSSSCDGFPTMGFIFLAIGGIWLWNLYNHSDE